MKCVFCEEETESKIAVNDKSICYECTRSIKIEAEKEKQRLKKNKNLLV